MDIYAGDDPVDEDDPSGLARGSPPTGERAAQGNEWVNTGWGRRWLLYPRSPYIGAELPPGTGPKGCRQFRCGDRKLRNVDSNARVIACQRDICGYGLGLAL